MSERLSKVVTPQMMDQLLEMFIREAEREQERLRRMFRRPTTVKNLLAMAGTERGLVMTKAEWQSKHTIGDRRTAKEMRIRDQAMMQRLGLQPARVDAVPSSHLTAPAKPEPSCRSNR